MPQASSRLEDLAGLPANWDGYGSPPIAPTALDGAEHVLHIAAAKHLPEPYLGPVTGGGVQIEWHVGNRRLEMETLPDGSVELITVEGDEYSDEMRFASYRTQELSDLLRWVTVAD